MQKMVSWPLKYSIPLLLLMLAASVALYDFVRYRGSEERAVEQSWSSIAMDRSVQLRKAIERQSLSGELINVQTEIEIASAARDVKAVIVLKGNDEVLFSSRPEHKQQPWQAVAAEIEAQQSGDVSGLVKKTQTTGQPALVISQNRRSALGVFPLAVNGREPSDATQPSVLLIAFDLTAVKDTTQLSVERRIIEFGLLCVALAALLWILFHFALERRVDAIVLAARRVAGGDLAARSHVDGADEVGQIGKAFDRMAETLSFAQNQAQQSERTLGAIVASAVDPIITIDARGVIRSLNPATERLFGFRSEEMLGQNIKMLMPSPYRDEHDSYLNSYLATGIKKIIGIGREAVAQRKDGTLIPVELAVSEVNVSGTRLFTGIIHDISERKRAESELRRLNEELESRVEERTRELRQAQSDLVRQEKLAILGQLAGSVAHEIRNPLAVVKNAIYFLEATQAPSDQDSKDAFAEINRALATSNRIISELLDYARDPRREETVFPIDSVVDRALAMVPIPSSVRVDRQDREHVCHARADAGHVERVLVNLIQNAIQAMPDGGTLTTRCNCQNSERVVVEVSDTGTGIAPEDMARIFEPLFSRKVKGIGLGLPLSRRYAELNGGELTAENRPDQGATFRLTLPAK